MRARRALLSEQRLRSAGRDDSPAAVTAFRALSGRLGDTDVLAGHALYWYWAAAAYSAIWFVVYVTK